jgi:hypothetical protein
MNSPNRRVGSIVLATLGVLLLITASWSFNAFAVQSDQHSAAQAMPATNLTASNYLPIFRDEFDGDQLDGTKWDVFKGNPIVSGGWLTLPGAEIQSKAAFGCGILQGVIQSTDWKPQSQFTDSSFGFEIWTGTNNQCHYGATFKASGHLAVLRSLPDGNGNCSGDPQFQAYVPVSNWDTIRSGGIVSFTLTYSNSVVLTISDGLSNNGQAIYTDQAVPTVPLKIRLYAHTFDTSLAENYHIDYIRLYPCYAVYLPIIIRST